MFKLQQLHFASLFLGKQLKANRLAVQFHEAEVVPNQAVSISDSIMSLEKVF